MNKLLLKQEHAVYYLKDNSTNEVLFGGGAGGGKSVLGVLWLIECCQKYKGSRWLMGRSKLKALKETTLNTFFYVTSSLGISNQYVYNAQSGVIRWTNGSEIILKDLFLYPSDPNFDSLGSLEITGAFIDECNQVDYKAWQVVKSRIRYRLTDFNLIPKMLGTCNPAKNWVYHEFFLAKKENRIKPYRKFIQALAIENPNLPESYIESLGQLDNASRERLLHGNWEYENNPNALCDYEAITNIFYNEHVKAGKKYITADIARLGSDKAVIFVWSGFKVIDYLMFEKSTLTQLSQAIKTLAIKHQVPRTQIVADEDGVGGGVVDILKIKGFINNSKALNNENYKNLKTQCYYKLAKLINTHELYLDLDISEGTQKEIIEELEQIESYQIDTDAKMQIKPKDAIKRILGRSPDWSDALAMRLFFEMEKKKSIRVKV